MQPLKKLTSKTALQGISSSVDISKAKYYFLILAPKYNSSMGLYYSWCEFLTTTSLKIQMARSICLCLLNNASIFPNFELTL